MRTFKLEDMYKSGHGYLVKITGSPYEYYTTRAAAQKEVDARNERSISDEMAARRALYERFDLGKPPPMQGEDPVIVVDIMDSIKENYSDKVMHYDK